MITFSPLKEGLGDAQTGASGPSTHGPHSNCLYSHTSVLAEENNYFAI